jgi:hypothetical protein
MWDASNKLFADAHTLVNACSGFKGAQFLANVGVTMDAKSVPAARLLLTSALDLIGTDYKHALDACVAAGAVDHATAGTCVLRMAILQHLDLVDTFAAVHGADVDPSAMREILDGNCWDDACLKFASVGNCAALRTLLARHPCFLGPYAVNTLYWLPDAMHPPDYLPLAEQIALWDGEVVMERDIDPMEEPAAARLLGEQFEGVVQCTDKFLLATGALAVDGRRADGVLLSELDNWVLDRVLVLDDTIGHLPLAMTLLKAWLRMGRGSVAPSLSALNMMGTLIRHSDLLAPESQEYLVTVSARDWLASTEPAQVQGVLRMVFPHDDVGDIPHAASLLTQVRLSRCARCVR